MDTLERNALLQTRLTMRTVLGAPRFFASPLWWDEPEVVADERGVRFLYADGDLTYVLALDRRYVMELRRRGHFYDVRVFTVYGRQLGAFRQPLGNPNLN